MIKEYPPAISLFRMASAQASWLPHLRRQCSSLQGINCRAVMQFAQLRRCLSASAALQTPGLKVQMDPGLWYGPVPGACSAHCSLLFQAYHPRFSRPRCPIVDAASLEKQYTAWQLSAQQKTFSLQRSIEKLKGFGLDWAASGTNAPFTAKSIRLKQNNLLI